MRFAKAGMRWVDRPSNRPAVGFRHSRALALRNVFKSSICKIGLEIAAVLFDCPLFTLLSDPSVHPLHKTVELPLGNCILLKRIIIRMNCYRTKSDNVIRHERIPMSSPLAARFKERRQIAPRLGRRKRLHARYYDDIAGNSSAFPSVIPLLNRPPVLISY